MTHEVTAAAHMPSLACSCPLVKKKQKNNGYIFCCCGCINTLNAVCCGPEGPKIISENTTPFLKNTTLQKKHFTKHNSASQKAVTFQKTQQLYSMCFVKCYHVLTFGATVKSDTGSEMPQRGTDEQIWLLNSVLLYSVSGLWVSLLKLWK